MNTSSDISQLFFCLQDFAKIFRLHLADVSTTGLRKGGTPHRRPSHRLSVGSGPAQISGSPSVSSIRNAHISASLGLSSNLW